MDFGFTQALWSAVPDTGFVLAVFLLSLRLSAIFLLTPILYAFEVPATVRLLLIIGMAVALAAGVPADVTRASLALDAGQLIAASAVELALGATLALGVALDPAH